MAHKRKLEEGMKRVQVRSFAGEETRACADGCTDDDDDDGDSSDEEIAPTGDDLEALMTQRSVSWQRIPAPSWLRLPSDVVPLAPAFSAANLPPLLSSPPETVQRCTRAHCEALAPPHKGIDTPCWILSSLSATPSMIRLQRCLRRDSYRGRPVMQGPDLRHLGLFNWNNTLIFTFELLNRFASNINAGEMPYNAFAATQARAYREAASGRPFVAPGTFRRVHAAFKSCSPVINAAPAARTRTSSSSTPYPSASVLAVRERRCRRRRGRRTLRRHASRSGESPRRRRCLVEPLVKRCELP